MSSSHILNTYGAVFWQFERLSLSLKSNLSRSEKGLSECVIDKFHNITSKAVHVLPEKKLPSN